MPLPSISRLLFMLLFCSCVLCPTEHTCNSAPPILSKKKFQSNFHPFSPRLLCNKQHKYCPRTVSVCSSVMQLFFSNLQIASSCSCSQNMKNQRTVVCPGVFFGRERIRIKEPSVAVISETSKNRQLRLFHKHQRTVS
jgi:hypothetical protein